MLLRRLIPAVCGQIPECVPSGAALAAPAKTC